MSWRIRLFGLREPRPAQWTEDQARVTAVLLWVEREVFSSHNKAARRYDAASGMGNAERGRRERQRFEQFWRIRFGDEHPGYIAAGDHWVSRIGIHPGDFWLDGQKKG